MVIRETVNETLKSVRHIDSGEEIVFSNGKLNATQNGYSKKWHAYLYNVKNYELLIDTFKNSKTSNFEFLCESGRIYYGKITVQEVPNNNNFELLGDGPLNIK